MLPASGLDKEYHYLSHSLRAVVMQLHVTLGRRTVPDCIPCERYDSIFIDVSIVSYSHLFCYVKRCH